MKYSKYIIIFLISFFLQPAFAGPDLAQKLAGKILLQVESAGEAWYVSPANLQRYYLGRPADAFNIMREHGVGITNNDLDKIPAGLIEYIGQDDDQDGLINDLEIALGTNMLKKDTDGDGYDDRTEIINNQNPFGVGRLKTDSEFTENNLGKIFLQVEKNGEAWYIDPSSKKRYFLRRPLDAFSIMRQLSLGITDENLSKIPTKSIITQPSTPPSPTTPVSDHEIISAAADAIRAGDAAKVTPYFVPNLKKAIEHTMNFLNPEGRLTLGNMLSGAKLTSSSLDEKIYTAEVYFSGEKYPINFHMQKQENGEWKLTNL